MRARCTSPRLPVALRTRNARRWLQVSFVFGLGAVGLGLVLGCSHSAPPGVRSSTVLRIGMPQLGLATYLAISLKSEGLFAHGVETDREPRLAERWESLDGGRTIRFHIRGGVKFSDGTPVTPELVKQSLEASVADPVQTSQYPMLRSIAGVVARQTTVDVALAQASALAFDDLVVPIELRRPGKPPLSTGPFAVASESPDLTTMRASLHYYKGRPSMDEVEIRSYPNVRAAWTAMMRDEIDFLYEVPWDAREFVAQDPGVQVYSFLRPYVYVLLFNTQRPVFARPELRVALSAAVDREQLVRTTLAGRGTAAKGPVFPRVARYQADLPWFPYDPAGARRQIEQVEQQTRSGSGPARPIRFRCLVVDERAPFEHLALVLQRAFREVGVEMELHPVTLKTLVASVESGNFDVALADLPAVPGLSRLYSVWHSSINPVFRYRGADAELDRLRGATTEEALRAAGMDAQRAFHRDPPAIFLFWSETARALSRRFDPTPLEPGRDVVASLWHWRLAQSDARRSRVDGPAPRTP